LLDARHEEAVYLARLREAAGGRHVAPAQTRRLHRPKRDSRMTSPNVEDSPCGRTPTVTAIAAELGVTRGSVNRCYEQITSKGWHEIAEGPES
jgi:hypothetical protein